MNAKFCRESRVIKTNRVFQNDVNSHNTLFGGRLMSDIDQVASISALSTLPYRLCNGLNRFVLTFYFRLKRQMPYFMNRM